MSPSKTSLLLVSVSANSGTDPGWMCHLHGSHYMVSGLQKTELAAVFIRSPMWMLMEMMRYVQVTVCYAWNEFLRTCYKLVMEWTSHSSAQTQQLFTKEMPGPGTVYWMCCQDQKLEKERIICNVCCILPPCCLNATARNNVPSAKQIPLRVIRIQQFSSTI